MSENLTDDKIKEFKEAFEMFDRDKDGLINQKELGNILRSLGHEPTDHDLNDMIAEVDSNDDKRIDLNEFMQIMHKRAKQSDIEEELTEAFKIFDKEGNGLIPSSEFRHIMITLGEKLTEDEVDEMIKEADYKGEGLIDYKEFVKVMLSR
jgi:Ca2+-binding EF-hand superfamily protein